MTDLELVRSRLSAEYAHKEKLDRAQTVLDDMKLDNDLKITRLKRMEKLLLREQRQKEAMKHEDR